MNARFRPPARCSTGPYGLFAGIAGMGLGKDRELWRYRSAFFVVGGSSRGRCCLVGCGFARGIVMDGIFCTRWFSDRFLFLKGVFVCRDDPLCVPCCSIFGRFRRMMVGRNELGMQFYAFKKIN